MKMAGEGEVDGSKTTDTVSEQTEKAAESIEELSKETTELEKYWTAVKENPSDFTGWTYLLQFVEQESKMESAREAFDAFFTHYPYCFGYWKKYADMEKKHEDVARAEEVFERGLKAIPLSVELWLHYISFYISTHEDTTQEGSEEKIRRLYDRALATAGKDFRADKLWDSFIKWEQERKELVNVTMLYRKLLATPIQLYSYHFDNFKKHVEENHPKEMLSLDEFLQLRREVVTATQATPPDGIDVPTEMESDTGPAGEAPPPGVDAPPPGTEAPPPGEEAPPSGLEAPPGMKGGKVADDEIPALREKIIEKYQVIHRTTEQEVSKRWAFEEGIKRPYFHVKPLERVQLKNWREYLDYEIINGSHERVVVLFERCMIACALYEDFWLKYAEYVEAHSVEAVRNVYRRACWIHLTQKPHIHMAWAAFEERQGNLEAAREILTKLERMLPKLAMVRLRRIGLERRRANHTIVEQLYNDYINDSQAAIQVRSFFAIKYARYLGKILGQPEQAKEVLHKAIVAHKANPKLYLQLIDVEYQCQPVDEQKVLELFDQVIHGEQFPIHTKVTFSQRKLEFVEDLGTDVISLNNTYTDHQKILKEYQLEKKRKSQDAAKGEPTEKKTKADPANGTNTSSHCASNAANSSTPPSYPYSHWPGYPGLGGYSYPNSHWGSYNSSYYPS